MKKRFSFQCILNQNTGGVKIRILGIKTLIISPDGRKPMKCKCYSVTDYHEDYEKLIAQTTKNKVAALAEVGYIPDIDMLENFQGRNVRTAL